MNVIEKMKKQVFCTAANLMTVPASDENKKKQSAKTIRAKKIIMTTFTIMIFASLCSVTVFAASGGSTTTLDGPAKEFFTNALGVLKTVLILIGAGVGIWGIVNLLEGYGNDNPGAKSQGMKQLMAGVGVAIVGVFAPEALKSLL